VKKGKRNSTENMWDSRILQDEDIVLRDMVDDFFRAERDILEVRCDPAYAETDEKVKTMLADHKRGRHSIETQRFICGNLNEEIREIKEEIKSNRLDELSSAWVSEWHKKRQQNGAQTREIREFIAKSLTEAEKQGNTPSPRKKEPSRISLIIRHVSAAAAILTGVIFVVATLVNHGDPGRLFDKYYEPVPAISPVTRNMNVIAANIWLEAVSDYNKGDYSMAVAAFTELVSRDASLAPPRFYLAMSHLSLGNTNLASQLLREIADTRGEYSGEARWYLGLAYLKEGDKEKAAACFESLSKTSGYYSERSTKILRRLK